MRKELNDINMTSAVFGVIYQEAMYIFNHLIFI